MSKMKIEQMILGMVQTNCYLVYNEETKEAILIDPADKGEIIAAKLREKELSLKAVLLTHGHFDHIFAVPFLKQEFQVPVYCNELEVAYIENPGKNLSSTTGREISFSAEVELKDGEVIELAGFQIVAIHTPGHTPGGVSYFFKDEKVLFSGDTLFCESVGRTDFPGGSMTDLVKSISEKLFVLPEETVVYPGHEHATSIGHEKEANPFIGGDLL